MNLQKELWTKKDVKHFLDYLKQFSKGQQKAEWEKRIANTSLPCLAIPSKEVQNISKKISKGNFISFLNLWIWSNLSVTFVIGNLIAKIDDPNVQQSYLRKFAKKADNWATIDTVKIKPKQKDENIWLEFCASQIKSENTFSRRLGVVILLKMINDRTIDSILDIVKMMKEEREYYVNMALAWLLAECFVKQRDKTLAFLKHNKLSKFVTNKMISKCHDSFRVTKQDKEMLKKFKVL